MLTVITTNGKIYKNCEAAGKGWYVRYSKLWKGEQKIIGGICPGKVKKVIEKISKEVR